MRAAGHQGDSIPARCRLAPITPPTAPAPYTTYFMPGSLRRHHPARPAGRGASGRSTATRPGPACAAHGGPRPASEQRGVPLAAEPRGWTDPAVRLEATPASAAPRQPGHERAPVPRTRGVERVPPYAARGDPAARGERTTLRGGPAPGLVDARDDHGAAVGGSPAPSARMPTRMRRSSGPRGGRGSGTRARRGGHDHQPARPATPCQVFGASSCTSSRQAHEAGDAAPTAAACTA